jgi:hypothetical protein
MMECPKCGATQEDGREDCASCGIIFERWQRAQEQAFLARGTGRFAPEPGPTEEERRSVPLWLVAIVALAVIGVGLFWTMKRREARATAGVPHSTDALNDLNDAGIAVRQRLQAENDREARRKAAIDSGEVPEGSEAQLTGDINALGQTTAIELLQRCGDASTPDVVHLPKEYPYGAPDVFSHFPELEAAQRIRLIASTRDGGTVKQTLDVRGIHQVTESTDEFLVNLGRRRVLRIDLQPAGGAQVHAKVAWGWENGPSAMALKGLREQSGEADFVRDAQVWRVMSSVVHDGNRFVTLCQ